MEFRPNLQSKIPIPIKFILFLLAMEVPSSGEHTETYIAPACKEGMINW